VPRSPRLLRLVHLFPAKKNPMRETLRLAPLGLAEPCTGNSAVAADLWAAQPRFLVKLAARFAERSVYSAGKDFYLIALPH
jgi:hypothetical protein